MAKIIMVLLRHSNLPSPLNEVNMRPALVFRCVNVVVNKTSSYFKNANMSYCVDILVSLEKNSTTTTSAVKALENFFSRVDIKDSKQHKKLWT